MTELHPWFFRNHIDVQKSVCITSCFFVHNIEAFTRDSIRKRRIVLVQLHDITTSLVLKIKYCVAFSLNVRGTPTQLCTRKQIVTGTVFVFGTQMIQHACSCNSIHIHVRPLKSSKTSMCRFSFSTSEGRL